MIFILEKIDLNRKILGRITAKEILGGFPPLRPDTEDMLKHEFEILIKELENKTEFELKAILDEQNDVHEKMNSKPGAMALAQDKILMFTGYNEKYIRKIKDRIDF